MPRTRRVLAGLALGLAACALLAGCAGRSGGAPGGAPPVYYPGPPYWDPARGTFIDPLTGQPVQGGWR
jgi:hypothetical protein